MLNRDINGGPLIKIIPACFDRSIDRSNEKHWPNRCGQTTGKICPLSLQTFCTGRRYTSGAALVGERLAKETRDFALACSMKNRHGVSSSRRSILSWRSISTEVDLIADSPTSLHDDAITERIVIYTPLLYSPPCNNEGRFYLIWQETFLSSSNPLSLKWEKKINPSRFNWISNKMYRLWTCFKSVFLGEGKMIFTRYFMTF